MRVVAGSARGTRLQGPGRLPVRPTSDRVREALFNVLGPGAVEGDVLDGFAGCGTLGIEALSRGGRRCVFIESNARCRGIIRRNLDRAHLADRGSVLGGDVLRSARRLRSLAVTYDLVLLDPPYALLADAEGWRRLSAFLVALIESRLIAVGARLVVEHRAGDEPADLPPGLGLLDRRAYGDTGLTLLAPEAV